MFYLELILVSHVAIWCDVSNSFIKQQKHPEVEPLLSVFHPCRNQNITLKPESELRIKCTSFMA